MGWHRFKRHVQNVLKSKGPLWKGLGRQRNTITFVMLYALFSNLQPSSPVKTAKRKGGRTMESGAGKDRTTTLPQEAAGWVG